MSQRHSVVPYVGRIPASHEARKAEEDAALGELLSLLPEGARETARALLGSSDWNTATGIHSVPGPPRAAELLGKIYALRQATKREKDLAEQCELATHMPASVVVAVLPRSRNVQYKTSVTREASRGLFENRVVLATGALTPERLTHALTAVARSRVTHGQFPRNRVRIVGRSERTPPITEIQRAFAEQVLEQLRSAALRDVRGVGRVKAVTIEVGPVEAGQVEIASGKWPDARRTGEP